MSNVFNRLLAGVTATIAGVGCLSYNSTVNNSVSSLSSIPIGITVNAATVYTLSPPVKNYTITSNYGWRTLNGKREFHPGVDMVSKTDQSVYAAEGGEIIEVNRSCTHHKNFSCAHVNKYGNSVKIKTSDGRVTIYGHMNPNITVKKGDKVKSGTKLGVMGDYGAATGVHLHFEIRKSGYSEIYDSRGNGYSVNTNPSSGNVKYTSTVANEITSSPVKENSIYTIQLKGSGLYIGEAGTKNFSNVRLTGTINNASKWKAIKKGNGWQFMNMESKKLLDVYGDSSASIKNLSNVQVYEANSCSTNVFNFQAYNNAYFINTAKSGYCLDVYGNYSSVSKIKSGANIQAYARNNDITQQFVLNKVG